MTRYCFLTILIFAVLVPFGCGYRLVDPFPASDYALISVRNVTSEPGLAPLLEEEMRGSAGFKESSAKRLSVAITGFRDTVDSVGSTGSPLRQELTMEVSWKVEGPTSSQAIFGKEVVVRTYPYSTDLTTLDWNRDAAVRLLIKMAASEILDSLGEQP